MEEKNVVLPVRNLSGTNSQQLQEDYIRAMEYVRAATERFNRIEFNARDYSDYSTFNSAAIQRNEMHLKLCEVYDYLETVAISLNS